MSQATGELQAVKEIVFMDVPDVPPEHEPPKPSPLSGPLNQFTVSLFHLLASKAGEENVFLSPLSVSTCTSMLMLGARTQSLSQLRKGLHFDSLDGSEKTVHTLFQELINDRINGDDSLMLANYFLIQKGGEGNEMLQRYKSDLQSLYSAKLDDVDFTVDSAKILTTVNNWVQEKTKGLIKTILTVPPNPDTRLILLNAIYFKGKWDKPFDKEMTQKMPFFNKGVEEVETDFMTRYGTSFPYAFGKIGGEETHIVELPYQDGTTTMIIVLPEKRDGLKSMLTAESLHNDLTNTISNDSSLPRYPTKLDLFLPKFKLETEYVLNGPLSELGMSDIFEEEKADLSGIAGSKDLYVSLAKHKAVVKVDEEGTEAAAVSAMIFMCCMSMPMPNIVVQVDHPFLFVIKDKKTGLALFIGKVETF